jgi:hypothetical protein
MFLMMYALNITNLSHVCYIYEKKVEAGMVDNPTNI